MICEWNCLPKKYYKDFTRFYWPKIWRQRARAVKLSCSKMFHNSFAPWTDNFKSTSCRTVCFYMAYKNRRYCHTVYLWYSVQESYILHAVQFVYDMSYTGFEHIAVQFVYDTAYTGIVPRRRRDEGVKKQTGRMRIDDISKRNEYNLKHDSLKIDPACDLR